MIAAFVCGFAAEAEAATPAYSRLATALGSSDYSTRYEATKEALQRGGIAIVDGGKVVAPAIGPRSIMSLSSYQVANLALQSGTESSTVTLAELGSRWVDAQYIDLKRRNAGSVMSAFIGAMVRAERKRASQARAFTPLFIDQMAKRRYGSSTNLGGAFAASGISINGLEEILLAVSIERFIPKVWKSVETKSQEGSNSVPRAIKPCSDLIEKVGGGKWAAGKAVKEGVKNNILKPGLGWAVEALWDIQKKAVELVVKRIFSFLKVVDVVVEIYKTAVMLTSTTMKVQAAEAEHEQPEGLKPDFSDFTATAGVDEQTQKEYLDNVTNDKLGTNVRDAITDCMKAVGLPAPYWSDTLVDDLEKFKVEWELTNPDQWRYNMDFVLGGGKVGEGGTLWETPPEPLIGYGQLARDSSLPTQAKHIAKLRIEPQDPWKGKKGMWRKGEVTPVLNARLDTSKFESDALIDLAFAAATEDPFGILKSVTKMASETLKSFYGPKDRGKMAVTYHYKCGGNQLVRVGARDGEVCTFTPPKTYSGTFTGKQTEVGVVPDIGGSGTTIHNWRSNLTFTKTDCPADAGYSEEFSCYDLSLASLDFTYEWSYSDDVQTCSASGSGSLTRADFRKYPGFLSTEELVVFASPEMFEMTEAFGYSVPLLEDLGSEGPGGNDAINAQCTYDGETDKRVEDWRLPDDWSRDMPTFPALEMVPPYSGPWADAGPWTYDLNQLSHSYKIDKQSQGGDHLTGTYSWDLTGSD